MLMRFSDDLSVQGIYAVGDELASVMGMDKDAAGKRVHIRPTSETAHVADFQNPVLVTDHYRISRLQPPSLRDTVFKLYESPVRITQYGKTSFSFEQRRFPGLWGPSIDTLLFAKALNGLDFNNAELAIEVGAGSGFLSKYSLDLYPGIRKMLLMDINIYSQVCASEQMNDGRARHLQGDATELMKNRQCDLLLCNPPYIPRPRSVDDNPYEGLSLLQFLISHAVKNLSPGGAFVTNFSSLSFNTAYGFCKDAGVNVEVLESMRVPLKVLNVLNNPEWMEYLKKNCSLERNMKDGYEYWHTINIVQIKPK